MTYEIYQHMQQCVSFIRGRPAINLLTANLEKIPKFGNMTAYAVRKAKTEYYKKEFQDPKRVDIH